MGVRIGAPSFLIKNTTNFAGFVLLGCFRKLFRKERIHLLGMRCRGKSEGKDKYREDELLHVMHRFCPFGDVLR